MREIVLTAITKGTKGMYTIEIDGVETVKEVIRVFESPDNLPKKRTIEVLIRALADVANIVKHEDTLTIRLENIHLVNWLASETEYAGYDKIHTAITMIDDLDCHVKYEATKLRNMKRKLEKEQEEKEQVLGFARIMMDD